MNDTISITDLQLYGIEMKVMMNELEKSFPPYLPTPSDDLPEVYYRSGQRSVVEWIQNYMSENSSYGK